MARIKVLVVDDSAFMRKIITDIINDTNDMIAIDTAKNGEEAIKKVKELSPDVVTLDIEMPVLDGLSALETIMRETPVPVLMLSSLTKEGADATLKALEHGAVDFITKPSSIFKINADDVKNQILEKVRMASKVKLSRKTSVYKPTKRIKPKHIGLGQIKKIIAIGTSTGGPRALQSVIPLIPSDIDASILVVQHMPRGFTKSLADRLDSMSEVSVKEAEDNEVLKPGHVYIAPGDYHLRLDNIGKELKIKLGTDGLVTGHKPSVDAMMDSIADLGLRNVIGVILTGMGSDGAKGLKKVKDNNNYIIAQDEETCVVFGMPKSAIKLNAVDKVVPLENITTEIIKAMGV